MSHDIHSLTQPDSPQRHFSILSPTLLNNNHRKTSISLYQPFTILDPNEKEEVKMLDKWVNDFQYHSNQHVDEALERNIRNFKKKTKEIKENASKNGPYLNQQIINNSLYDRDYFSEDQKPEPQLEDFEIKTNFPTKGKILKNQQTLRNDKNAKVLNQIMFRKLNKFLRKPNDLSEILMRGKILSQETMNGFKSLKNDFSDGFSLNKSRNKEIIEKLRSLNGKPEKTFDLELEQKTLNELRLNYKVREKVLWDGYYEVEGEIKKKKEMVNDIRRLIADLAMKKQRNVEDLDLILRKFEMLEDRTTKAQQMANKPNIGKRGSIVEANRSQINHSIPSLMKITKIREEREHQKNMILDHLEKINKETKIQTGKLEEIATRIKDLRVKKLNIRLQLKELYNETMKRDCEEDQYLISILKSLKKLGYEANEDGFPRYLDQDSKDYLMKLAEIEVQIEQLNWVHSQIIQAMNNTKTLFSGKKMNIIQNLNKKDISKKLEDFKTKLVNSQYIIEGYQQKNLDFPASKLFIVNNSQKLHAKKCDTFNLNDYQTKNLEDSELKGETLKKEAMDNSKSLTKRIQDLANVKENLRINEVSRLMGLSVTDEKQALYLEKRLKLLFGKKDCEVLIDEFKKEKLKITQKIQSNQTYSFGSNVNGNFNSNTCTRMEIPEKIMKSYKNLKENVMNEKGFYYRAQFKKDGNRGENDLTDKSMHKSFFTTFACNKTFHFSNKKINNG